MNVEFIRGYIFIFLFYVWIQLRVWSILTFFSILLIFRYFARGLRDDYRGRGGVDYTEEVSFPGAKALRIRYVKSVFIIHVGGTRCVTSSIENIMKIRARITLTVEFIRGYIFKFLFYVWIQLRVWSILTFFSILLIFRYQLVCGERLRLEKTRREIYLMERSFYDVPMQQGVVDLYQMHMPDIANDAVKLSALLTQLTGSMAAGSMDAGEYVCYVRLYVPHCSV